MPILLPRCYICPSGSLPVTLRQSAEQNFLSKLAATVCASILLHIAVITFEVY